ncbi:hypothetical protein POM88_034017 [Heracleum sosnowskyi]|uniref:Uncharacterized protein n=1 Tax=Heracleum sosnowskyi TaxID=360622 RepID=A0AAD8HIH1_9APIA|nr:hypothetical protein POM88_034017 [Heracleum sosnowskyi]
MNISLIISKLFQLPPNLLGDLLGKGLVLQILSFVRDSQEILNTSLVWNYKYADVEFGRVQAIDLLQNLCSGLSNAHVDVIQGSRSVEVRADGVTKGACIHRILGEIAYNSDPTQIDYILCIGHFLGKARRNELEMEGRVPGSITSTNWVVDHDHLSYSAARCQRQRNKCKISNNISAANTLSSVSLVMSSLIGAWIGSSNDKNIFYVWGPEDQSKDIKKKTKYLVTFTVGFDQRNNIDATVKKFSEDFQILFFHYNGRTSEWDQFEWSKLSLELGAWSVELVPFVHLYTQSIFGLRSPLLNFIVSM